MDLQSPTIPINKNKRSCDNVNSSPPINIGDPASEIWLGVPGKAGFGETPMLPRPNALGCIAEGEDGSLNVPAKFHQCNHDEQKW